MPKLEPGEEIVIEMPSRDRWVITLSGPTLRLNYNAWHILRAPRECPLSEELFLYAVERVLKEVTRTVKLSFE